ncbi:MULTISPECIES: hypothetical protein [Pandoraea]|uniref:Transferrin-binding protein B C-lobe/N-lobe beta barrel domain-containing protein n=1 Tax=Pandoraea communis TaxID=2508297 RepID=A0A5E4XHX8_9BURK|nr:MULTISPECIES: hypothetical protein [Pandoraea]EON13657.1 hypothetical protein C266_10946 [Pandoraea sp. SD6-2]VVE36031.1 hypothetical protein PCO31110_03948 [Pandoraea communis]
MTLRKPILTRGVSRDAFRRVAALLSAMPCLMVAGISPAAAQTAIPDFGRFAQPSAPGSTVPSGAGGSFTQLNPGLYVQVLDGLINVTNPGGTQQFVAGQFGFTPQLATPPVFMPVNPGLTFTPPSVFRDPPPNVVTAVIPPVVIPPAALPSVLASGSGYYLMNWGSDGLGNLGSGTATFNVLNWLTNFTGSTMPFAVNSTLTAIEVGKLDDLGWGRWTSGSVSDHNVAFDLSTWRSGMPYLVGRPTLDANLPVSGTMTYALAGATKAVDMTTGAVGTLSGALSIAFQNGQYNVTPNLNIAMPGQTYVTGSGITRVGPDGARGTFTTMTQNVTGGACAGSACTFSTQGMLTGAAANNAGIVYSLTGPETRVIGAAGFKR